MKKEITPKRKGLKRNTFDEAKARVTLFGFISNAKH
jgi:hypothetical protein